jgi:RNA polymerase sigma-70 factor (ECF subfamily)
VSVQPEQAYAGSRVQQLVQAGDARAAATEALRALGPDILRYLRSVLRDEEDAADAFSDFAESLWSALPSFRGQSSLRTWAFRIAWHSALALRNEAWRRHGRRFATGEATGLADEIRTKTAVRVERQQHVLDTLRHALSDEEQSLLTLRLDQGFTWEGIAEIFSTQGNPVEATALMKRFERLKDRLARMVKDKGLAE